MTHSGGDKLSEESQTVLFSSPRRQKYVRSTHSILKYTKHGSIRQVLVSKSRGACPYCKNYAVKPLDKTRPAKFLKARVLPSSIGPNDRKKIIDGKEKYG
ncbi:hypothetical protein QE152_g30815 [Popillia japonica]|uniref:60S ribosomal protein L34 n=1 Tax=Popillia japonica TaxID=7064 RepID=A0AAW1JDL4_POPJA